MVDLGEKTKCLICKNQICECENRNEDGSWNWDNTNFSQVMSAAAQKNLNKISSSP